MNVVSNPMRQPQNAKRGRGRGRRGNNNSGHNHVPNRNTSYESNGPDVKLRGNAQQLHEKYMALAHDAATSGERIPAEAFTQFADHYFRLHQAAVGVAETKRQQDHADAVAADESQAIDPKEANVPDTINGVEPASAQLETNEAIGLKSVKNSNTEKVADTVQKPRSNAAKNRNAPALAKTAASPQGASSTSDKSADPAQEKLERGKPT